MLRAIETPNSYIREELIAVFWDWFICRWCGWDGNKNRVTHSDLRMVVPYVRTWVIADLKHRWQHASPGRFLPSRRLRNLWVKKERQTQREFLKLWEAELRGKNLAARRLPNPRGERQEESELQKAWEAELLANDLPVAEHVQRRCEEQGRERDERQP